LAAALRATVRLWLVAIVTSAGSGRLLFPSSLRLRVTLKSAEAARLSRSTLVASGASRPVGRFRLATVGDRGATIAWIGWQIEQPDVVSVDLEAPTRQRS
jgi:hypothetical protein